MTLVLGGAQEAESARWKVGGLITQLIKSAVSLGKMLNPEFPPVHPVCAKVRQGSLDAFVCLDE